MMELVDRRYFVELGQRDPREVCARTLCEYDEARRWYTICLWGQQYQVRVDEGDIVCGPDRGRRLPPFFDLFLVWYLLHARELEPAGEWISEKDIVGGATFFRGPHELPTHLLTERFGDDIDDLKGRFRQLGGVPLELADAAASFLIAPRVPVAVLYWRGDEDFSAEAKILYDKTVSEHLTTDIVFALAVGVCERLGRPAVS